MRYPSIVPSVVIALAAWLGVGERDALAQANTRSALADRLDLGIRAPVPPTADLLNRNKLLVFYDGLSYPDRMLLLNRCTKVLTEPDFHAEEFVAICRMLARL